MGGAVRGYDQTHLRRRTALLSLDTATGIFSGRTCRASLGRMRRCWVGLPLSVALGATGFAGPLPLQDLLKNAGPGVVHLSVRDAANEEEGSGSGFVLSDDGRVVTNHHVIDGARRIIAMFADGKEVEVVGVWAFSGSEKDDIAVLQLAPGRYPALRLAGTPAQQGDEVVVIGSPHGLSQAITTGIVAAVREHGTVTRRTKDGPESWGLQITAGIAPGSSGSPILNASGDVVGVAVGTWGGTANFGVPVDRVRKLTEAKGPTLDRMRPLSEARGGPGLRTNLLVSAALFGAISLAWWLSGRKSRSGTRSARGWPPSGR
jgi:putative serine protease PepD